LAFLSGWIATYIGFVFAWWAMHATSETAGLTYLALLFALLGLWLAMVIWMAVRAVRWVRKGALGAGPKV